MNRRFAGAGLMRRGGRLAEPVEATPLDFLTGVVLWLRPDAGYITLNGSTISSMVSRGSLGGNVSQGTAAAQATWIASDADFGGKPSISADGVDDFYPLPNLATLTEGELFLVAKEGGTTGRDNGLYRLSNDGGGAHWHTYHENVPGVDGKKLYEGFGTTARKPELPLATTNPTLSPFSYNVSSAVNAYSIRLNGTQIYSDVANTVVFPVAPDFLRNGAPAYHLGTLADFVLCDRVQSTSARAAWAQYCRRYGMVF